MSLRPETVLISEIEFWLEGLRLMYNCFLLFYCGVHVCFVFEKCSLSGVYSGVTNWSTLFVLGYYILYRRYLLVLVCSVCLLLAVDILHPRTSQETLSARGSWRVLHPLGTPNSKICDLCTLVISQLLSKHIFEYLYCPRYHETQR